MSNITTIQDTEAYQQVEQEYRATLREYRNRFGLAASLKINERLTEGAWHDDPIANRVSRLIDRMKHELAQEDVK